MKRIMTYAVLIAIGVYLGPPGIASTKDTQVGVADQVFAMMAAEGGLTEVHLGKLAADWAAGSEVKQLAQRLVQDHSTANQELMTIAKQTDISVPQKVGDTHADVVKLFSQLDGAQFDREFCVIRLCIVRRT